MNSTFDPASALDILAATEHYHVDSGKCASGANSGVCSGEWTSPGHVRGHVREAGYATISQAINACQSYGKTRKDVAERYRKEHGDLNALQLRSAIKARKAELYG